jgi:integrase/recombinase XerD
MRDSCADYAAFGIVGTHLLLSNLRHGVDIRTLQTWMGHRDIKSTMVYLKGVQSKDALAKVNAGALAAYVA